MPLQTPNTSALRKIAELAGSPEPAEQRLESILAVAREALGMDALAVVASSLSSELTGTWHAAAEGFAFDVNQARAQVARSAGETRQEKNLLVMPIPQLNGYRATLIGLGEYDTEASQVLLQVVSSYVAILIENESLARAVKTSNQVAHKRFEEIAAIYEIGQAFDYAHVTPLLDMIVAKAAAVMEAQACSLMLKSSADGNLVIEASFGLAVDIVKGAKIRIGEGIAGRVAQTGEPAIILDVAKDPRFSDKALPRAGISGSMCVPLRDEYGAVLGVLSIRRHEPNPPFDYDDLKLFGVFATHAALAISNAKLYSQLHRKVQEMSRISGLLRTINSTLDLELVLDQIVESITEVVGFDRCCVYLLDLRTNEFAAGARRGYGPNDPLVDRIKPGGGVIGLAAREQIPIFSQGSPTGPDGTGEFLAAPIIVRDSCIGVVVVDNSVQNRPIEPESVELLSMFVSQAGIAVENARLYGAMEEKYAELNVLYEHSRNISSAYGLDNVANMLVHTASKAVHCDGAGLLLLDTRRGHLKLQASAGKTAPFAQQIDLAALDEISVEFVRELRVPILVSADSPRRTRGENAQLLNALAPDGANLMLAPLMAEDATIGVLAIHREKSDEFLGAELKLVSILTSHAATVLKNAIIYEQKMRQRVLELSALYEFSKKISAAANLEQALDSILAIVADLADYDEGFIYAIDPERGVATVKAARFRGKPEDLPPDEPLDGASVTSWAISERKAMLSPDIARDPRFAGSQGRRHAVRSLMSIPLIVQDEVVGVLCVHNHSPNQYSEEDVRVLSIIASQGAAIYKELEALSALTSYTDNILSSIAAGVVTLDSDGVILTWNAAAEHIVGMKASRIVGLPYAQAVGRLTITPGDRDNLKRSIRRVFETGETYQGYKLCFHPKSGDEIYINMSISQLLNSAGERLGLVIIFEDISREIEMEDEFRRMGELAAVGQLAASIAHELRNPLSSIKGAAQFLQNEYETEGPIVEFLGIIIEEVNGLNRLTTEFLDFARPMQLELKPTSVNRLIERTLNLMGVHISQNNIAVRKKLSDTTPEIEADDEQLEQVLKNIIINALQAMPEGGSLSIETAPTPLGGACITITDTGIGIPPGKLDRIFQPFFTTKTKGTGLGLSVVNKIVENHGGRIEVSSELDKGSTFKIILPRHGIHTSIVPEIDATMERRVSGELRGGERD